VHKRHVSRVSARAKASSLRPGVRIEAEGHRAVEEAGEQHAYRDERFLYLRFLGETPSVTQLDEKQPAEKTSTKLWRGKADERRVLEIKRFCEEERLPPS
jgi:hypothetical protein